MRKNHKRILSLALALMLLFGLVPNTVMASEADTGVTVTDSTSAYSLSVNKTHYEVGEPILVTATGSGKDWVGIYKPNIGSAARWDYVTTQGSGVQFDIREATQTGNVYTQEELALPEGRYVIRLMKNNSSDFSNCACYIAITVGNPDTVSGDTSLMSIEKTTFAPGEKIKVTASGSGENWVGLYAINNLSRTHNDIWYYVSNANGVEKDILGNKTLAEGFYVLCWLATNNTAPANASTWTVIEISNDIGEGEGSGSDNEGGNTEGEGGNTGGSDSSDELVDNNDEGIIGLEKKTFKKGEPVMVAAVGADMDWLGIYDDANDQIANKWHYIRTAGSGVAYDILQGATFAPGTYLIRFVPASVNSDYTNNSTAHVYITITDEQYVAPDDGGDVGGGDVGGGDVGGGDVGGGEEPDEPETLLSLEKTVFKVGEPIMVTAVSTNEKDWIGLFNESGNYLKWYYVPSTLSGVAVDATQGAVIPAGNYSIRLIPNDGAKNTPPLARIDILIVDEVPSAPLDAQYTLSSDTDGYATGTVTVTMPANETDNRSVVMYWANEAGILSGYTPHARFKVTGEKTTFTIGNSVIIPEGATHLMIYSQISNVGNLSEGFVKLELPKNSSMDSLGTPTSRFWIVSDIHITTSLTSRNSLYFKKMLEDTASITPNASGIFVVGDIADSGKQAEYENALTLHSSVDGALPLYLAIGNHDLSGLSFNEANAQFLNYATLPDGTHPTDTSYDFWLDGTHYVFLGPDVSSGLYCSLSDETLAWLDATLAEGRDENKPTFLFVHQSIYNTVSGSLPGEGWHGMNNPDAISAILKKYPEVMLFNGHSHWTMDSVGNIFEGTDDLPIYAFNCASVAYLWSGYNKVVGEELDGSQGYLVELYDGKVLVRGRDFKNSEWISSAQYLIDVDGECGHSYLLDQIVYSNGFGKSGTMIYKCELCLESLEDECAPIIEALGYSFKESNSNGYGIAGGYKIDYEAKKAYESANALVLELGMIIINPEYASAESFFVNGELAVKEKSLQIGVTGDKYGVISYMVNGITDTCFDLDLIMSAYATEIADDGEKSYKTSFVQFDTDKEAQTLVKNDGTLHSVSLNSLKGNE